MTDSSPIPFETFGNFERVPNASPLFSCAPPDWAAAAHAIVVDDTVHYFEVNGDYYMLYAGLKGRGWGGDSECGSGLAVARRP